MRLCVNNNNDNDNINSYNNRDLDGIVYTELLKG